jgi:hypothetical protein
VYVDSKIWIVYVDNKIWIVHVDNKIWIVYVDNEIWIVYVDKICLFCSTCPRLQLHCYRFTNPCATSSVGHEGWQFLTSSAYTWLISLWQIMKQFSACRGTLHLWHSKVHSFRRPWSARTLQFIHRTLLFPVGGILARKCHQCPPFCSSWGRTTSGWLVRRGSTLQELLR